MQIRMEMVPIGTVQAVDAKTDAAADAGFPAAAAADAETAIWVPAVLEQPVPAAAAEHRHRTGNAGHTVRDTATAGTGVTGRAGMMLSGAGMAERGAPVKEREAVAEETAAAAIRFCSR